MTECALLKPLSCCVPLHERVRGRGYKILKREKVQIAIINKGVVESQVRSLALRRVRDAVRPEAALRLLEHHLDRVAPHADDLRRVPIVLRVA